jgi:O-methyltransferase
MNRRSRPMNDRPTPQPPSADAEASRRAYLDLLKLALCDLVAGETDRVETEVYHSDIYPVAHPVAEEDIGERVAGRDWPLHGLTMIGYTRLADLQQCIERVVADGVPGDVIEAGVWRGGASILARATLDSLGEHERTVWVADSFQGLPPPDGAFPEDSEMTLHRHDYLSVPRAYVEAAFRRLGLDHNLRFVEGFFSDTMPTLRGREWSLIRLDGDMYESTWVTLEALYPGLARGGYVVVDDYGGIPEAEHAIEDFRAANGIDAPLEVVDHTCVRWRREDEPDAVAATASQTAPRTRESPAEVSRPERIEVKSAGEARLERELDQHLAEQANQHAGEIAEYERYIAEITSVKPLMGGLRARLRALRSRG